MQPRNRAIPNSPQAALLPRLLAESAFWLHLQPQTRPWPPKPKRVTERSSWACQCVTIWFSLLQRIERMGFGVGHAYRPTVTTGSALVFALNDSALSALKAHQGVFFLPPSNLDVDNWAARSGKVSSSLAEKMGATWRWLRLLLWLCRTQGAVKRLAAFVKRIKERRGHMNYVNDI